MQSNNSINANGCSVCEAGKEKYTKCVLGAFRGTIYYQYDYRSKDGELFTTLQETLELCRAKRDKWMQEKNRKRLFPSTLQKMQDGKRLTKSEMAYQIGHVESCHTVAVSWDFFRREEIVSTFNRIFGTEIK
ncbi:hypothetical protein FACS1894181_03610 [Bacteroidia bacterium]|nr:hypothetical protein FACS1894181_03610 [Bacteroidia bacterium]